MAYQVINVKESKFDNADNVAILCYSSEPGKFLMGGTNTESLKMKRDDFNYVMRNRNYELGKMEGMQLNPSFGRFDYLTDFTLSDPETGEVK